jgi:biopolymer transport protein ExbD
MAKKRGPGAAALSAGEEVDMTSMIDVVFLLIIFFLCVTELSDASKEKLTLPRAVRAEEDQHEPGRMVINITKAGDVMVQRQKLNDQELYESLKKEKELSWDPNENLPTRAILVRVDRATAFEHVKRVMALCMQHKLWKLAFATKGAE